MGNHLADDFFETMPRILGKYRFQAMLLRQLFSLCLNFRWNFFSLLRFRLVLDFYLARSLKFVILIVQFLLLFQNWRINFASLLYNPPKHLVELLLVVRKDHLFWNKLNCRIVRVRSCYKGSLLILKYIKHAKKLVFTQNP